MIVYIVIYNTCIYMYKCMYKCALCVHEIIHVHYLNMYLQLYRECIGMAYIVYTFMHKYSCVAQ